MMNPAAISIAIMTVMLWILWSDSFRRRPSVIVYVVRIMLFLIVSGLMIVNLVRYPGMYGGGARTLSVLTVIVGIAGAAYFARRVVKRV